MMLGEDTAVTRARVDELEATCKSLQVVVDTLMQIGLVHRNKLALLHEQMSVIEQGLKSSALLTTESTDAEGSLQSHGSYRQCSV